MKAREYTYDPSKFYSGSDRREKKGNDSDYDSDDDEIEIYLNFKKEEKVDEDVLSTSRSLGLERVIKIQK